MEGRDADGLGDQRDDHPERLEAHKPNDEEDDLLVKRELNKALKTVKTFQIPAGFVVFFRQKVGAAMGAARGDHVDGLVALTAFFRAEIVFHAGYCITSSRFL